MKYVNRKITLFLVALAALLLVGCEKTDINNKYDSQAKIEPLSSTVVASNKNYELKWEQDAKCVLLTSKETNKVWSDILYDAYLNGSTSANANSALSITVINTSNMTWETTNSAAEMSAGSKMSCEKVDNGVCVTYYFERFEIAIPVLYELQEASLAISIDGSKIQENGENYQLISLGIAPYLCSASNADNSNYLFIPSGTGALMYTTEDADGTRKYSGEVYGTDLTRKQLKNVVTPEAIRLPVFGAKDGDVAMLGVIEEGAGAAFIEAQAGYARLGYSQVGATFYFRGYDTFRHGTYATGNAVITLASEERSMQKVKVSYYPLENDKADYNGMAECYRQYLIEQGMDKSSELENSAYSITFLGGTTKAQSFLGIPYKSLEALTTFEDAQSIMKELSEVNGEIPIIRMMNYGDNGILPGTIAGGKKYDSAYGTRKKLEALQDYCKEINASVFWDSDIIKYGKSGNGINNGSDSAETAIHYQAMQYPVSPIRVFDEENPYRIIGRDNLSNVMNKALKKADKYNHIAVSFSSLGQYAFSDYGKSDYVVRARIEKDVSELLKQAKANNDYVAVAGANSYAASVADVLFDVPLEYGEYNVLDEQIPFYQLVFHSYKPMYSSAVNLSDNIEKQIMLSAASGTGIGFSLTSNYIAESNDLQFFKLYGTLYDDNKTLIEDALKEYEYSDYYKKTSDSIMTRYELLGGGISATYYDNGIVLYANHTSHTVQSPVGELGAYEFRMQQKGGE